MWFSNWVPKLSPLGMSLSAKRRLICWFLSLKVWLLVKISASSFKHKVLCMRMPLCSGAPTLHPGGTTSANASFMTTPQIKAVRSWLFSRTCFWLKWSESSRAVKNLLWYKMFFFWLFLFTCLVYSPNTHTQAHTDTWFPVLCISGEEEHTVS